MGIQPLPFTSKSTRFNYNDNNNDTPAPTAYDPKTTIADFIPKQKLRAGPFGNSGEVCTY